MTYSIVARDADTGELGVAVQSHWFAVGPTVPWARPGVGAVATQAMAKVSYGPEALELLAGGASAEEALAQLTGRDDGAAFRQVAIVDAQGRVATHTGNLCIGYAGHVTGAQVTCQANIMVSEVVWGRMLETFENSSGPLAERLLVALEAAEEAGGDLRGRQSAAILVVPGAGEWWKTTVSLRVDDNPAPLPELRRLLRLHSAYAAANEGDDLISQGKSDEAAARFEHALELQPDSHELLFWSGLGLVATGAVDDGVARVRAAIALQPTWRELLDRLPYDVSPHLEVIRQRLS